MCSQVVFYLNLMVIDKVLPEASREQFLTPIKYMGRKMRARNTFLHYVFLQIPPSKNKQTKNYFMMCIQDSSHRLKSERCGQTSLFLSTCRNTQFSSFSFPNSPFLVVVIDREVLFLGDSRYSTAPQSKLGRPSIALPLDAKEKLPRVCTLSAEITLQW